MKDGFLNSFKSVLTVFCVFFLFVSCGGSGKNGGADGEKVSVAFNLSGVFENADGTPASSTVSAGALQVAGLDVTSLVFSYESENQDRFDKGSVDVLSSVIQGQNRVTVQLYPEVTYKLEIEAQNDSSVICRGSERAAIKYKGNTPVKLICALRTEVELNIDKKAEVLRLLPEKADTPFQDILDDIQAAIDNDMSISQVASAAELDETPSAWSVSNEYYIGLVAGFKELKLGNEAAYEKLKALIVSLGNTAELREALRVINDASSPFPEILVRPSSLDFGDVTVGYMSAPLRVNVLNLGYTDLDVSGISVSGGYNLSYDGLDDSCGSASFSLGTGESCSFNVRLKSFVLGARPGSVVISSNDTDESEAAVPLSARVVQVPPFTVNKTIFNFSSEIRGMETPVQTMTVTNTGGAAISSITVEAKTNFKIVNNCGLLPAGASCTIDISFVPVAVGAIGSVGEEFEVTASTGGTVNVYLQGFAVTKGTLMKSAFLEDTRIDSLNGGSLAACGDGRAHALFNTGTRLIYGFYDGDEWFVSGTVKEAESGKTIANAAIAADDECFPYAAYIIDGVVYYAALKTEGANAPWTEALLGTAHTESPLAAVSADSGVYVSFISADKKGFVLVKTDEPYLTPQVPRSFVSDADILDFDMAASADGALHFFAALDKGGNPAAAGSGYMRAIFSPAGTVWSDEYSFSADEAAKPLIVSAGGYMLAIYRDTAGVLQFYKNSGSSWELSPSAVPNVSAGLGYSVASEGGTVRLVYKEDLPASSVIKLSVYNGSAWSTVPSLVYEDLSKPFFMGNGNLALSGQTALFDKDSELVSSVFDGSAWSSEKTVIRQIGVNPLTSFDIAYDTASSAVRGVIGDKYPDDSKDYGGGIYGFSLEKQNEEPQAVFSTEKYFIRGAGAATDADGNLYSCFIYETGGASYAAYFSDSDSPVFIGASAGDKCSVSPDGAGNVNVAFVNDAGGLLSLWDSFSELTIPLVTDIDNGISFALKHLSAVNYLLYNSPAHGSLHFRDISSTDIQVDPLTTYDKTPHYPAMTGDSGGQVIVGLSGEYTEGAATSKLALYDCDPLYLSCDALYSEDDKDMISGLALGINANDTVYAAYYSGGEGVVLLEYPLGGGTYDRRIADEQADSSYYGDGVKLALNPENGLVHLLYRKGERLIYSTEELRPVLETDAAHMAFSTADSTDRTKTAELFISNSGFKPLAVNSVSIENGSMFVIDGGTCSAGSFTLGIMSEPCSIRVRFAPSAVGVYADRLKIEMSVGDKTVILTGGASGANF